MQASGDWKSGVMCRSAYHGVVARGRVFLEWGRSGDVTPSCAQYWSACPGAGPTSFRLSLISRWKNRDVMGPSDGFLPCIVLRLHFCRFCGR